MKRVPALKTQSDARARNGSAMPFDDAKIKGARCISTPTNGLREGFTRRMHSTNCGKGNLPKG